MTPQEGPMTNDQGPTNDARTKGQMDYSVPIEKIPF
jgi:hypothetical protein